MIEVEVDYSGAVAGLDAMPASVVRALEGKMKTLTLDLQGYVVSQKLQGQVLNHRSGRLARSIQQDVETEGNTVTGDVFSSGDVKYAAIHEYGGVITPVNAKALAFMIDGKMIFTQKVVMPERSYMRTSLAENKDRIVAGINAAALFGAREAMGE